MKPPELVNASQTDLDELLATAKPTFSPEQYLLLERVFSTFVYVMLSLQNAKLSIKRFQRMLFGHATEHKHNVLPAQAAAVEPPSAPSALAELPNLPDLPDPAEAAPLPDPVEPVSVPAVPLPAQPQPKKPKPGHGRNAAQDYSGAPIVECEHPQLQSGDRCPQCDKGRVYDSPPRLLVKVVGQAPLGATVYRVQRLRCRLCDTIFSAPLPAAVAALPKYDPSCASMIALLRYGNGMPLFRLEGLQASLNVPLPDATQWDIVSEAVPAPRAVFHALIHQAAQAPLLHSDDTPMKVLSLMAARAKAEAQGIEPTAKAIYTSGIVALIDEPIQQPQQPQETQPPQDPTQQQQPPPQPQQPTRQHKVVLFFTGHEHAGKNMERVLAQRARELPPPIQMCDGLAANLAGVFESIVANCLTHGRRQVVDVAEHFPAEARHVIEALAKVYEHDATCRKDALSHAQRLAFHQQNSKPIMDGLALWMNEQFAKHQVEPNSGLGKALRYLLTHWEPLTLFLRKAGAPLGRVEMWRGGGRSRHRCCRPFRLAVPYEPDRGSVSTSPSSNREHEH